MRGLAMPSGKVKWFNAKKGYGFITDDETKKDIFLHVSALESSKLRVLKEEQKIIYDIYNLILNILKKLAPIQIFLNLIGGPNQS